MIFCGNTDLVRPGVLSTNESKIGNRVHLFVDLGECIGDDPSLSTRLIQHPIEALTRSAGE